jgi:N-methylhydantoinase B/oxoprolinase/acetone carboxylase alpha subunit
MGSRCVIRRTPRFSTGLDFSCAIFDDGGEMIAQAEFCPAQLGAIIYVVEWTILGRENFRPGVVLHNDPFRGGCHLPEYCVIKPASSATTDRLSRASVTPKSGKVPADLATQPRSQEGIRIPPLKIVDAGEDVEAVGTSFANVRSREPRTAI